ncbi:MAG: hypothetical protein GC172_10020 [Phycisphaera sp.]|nr:hypothetical protein [Phycisphaera sp.]
MNWLAIPTEAWTSLTYAGGVLALIAGILIARAVRGTPVGWQPICRRCGHDLRTVDPSKGACPECGADLTRAGAVRTGGRVRRAGPIVIAVAATAVAGAAMWWVTPTRVFKWRMDLVASMPFDQLVDLVVSGLGEQDDRGMAQRAIDARLGSRGGFPQQGAQRSLPSGELLDALVKAFARSNEPGRTPLAAAIDGAAGQLLRRLDEAERAKLVELAVEEMIASRGTVTDLARCAVITDRFSGSFDSAMLDAIQTRLGTTAEGRAVLASRVIIEGAVASGGTVQLGLQSPIDSLRTNRDPFRRRTETIFIEQAEAVSEADGSGSAAPIPLRVSAELGGSSMGMDISVPPLLADLEPGRYRLRIKGVIAPTALVPTRDRWTGQTLAAITAADAAKLEGARTIDDTITLEVENRQSPPPPLERVAEQSVLEAFATRLRGSRLDGRAGGVGQFDIADPPRDRSGVSIEPSYRFAMIARQGGKTQKIGTVSGSGGSRSMSGGGLPNSVDRSQPFELVLDPMAFEDESTRIDRRVWSQQAQGPLIWARFTMRFENAAAAPEVVVEPLDDTPVVATAVARSEARDMLAESIGRPVRTSRFGRPAREADTAEVSVSFGAVTGGAPAPAAPASDDDATPTSAAPRALLTGYLELRASGSLLAPIAPVVVALGPRATSVSFEITKDAGNIFPRTIRYTPDPAVALSREAQSFRYIAEPFELRYLKEGAPPELVWLEDQKPSDGSVQAE